MKSDLVHKRVQTGPQVQWPKANHKPADAEELNLDKATKRTHVEPTILEQLVREVKETVATDVAMSKAAQRPFGALSMYALRRNRRYTARTRKQPQFIIGFGY